MSGLLCEGRLNGYPIPENIRGADRKTQGSVSIMPYQAALKMDRHGLTIDGRAIIRMAQLPHPSDEYLHMVLAETGNAHDKYVVWTYNGECGGFNNGHYFKTYPEALEYFNKRMKEYDEKYRTCIVQFVPRATREAHYNEERAESDDRADSEAER